MRRLALLACVLLYASVAYADGGRLQMRRRAGPFVVSLFSVPETLAIGDADLSVMVEQQGSGHVLPDVEGSLELAAADKPNEPSILVPLTHRTAANRLMSDAIVRLPHAGMWHAVLHIRAGGQVAETTTELTVADHSARRGTVWFFVLAPLCLIGAFFWVEGEKGKARRARLAQPT